MTFNEITNAREGQDKSGRNFKTITLTCTTFSQMTHPITGATVNALGNSTTQTLNAWESGVDSPYNHLYNAGAGTAVVGTLVSREVEPYQIEDSVAGNVLLRDVNTYSCFVPADESAANFESAVKSAFRWNGHPLASSEVSA
jgi:hypothetical protein